MTMGSKVQADVSRGGGSGNLVAPVSLSSAWKTVVAAPGPATADGQGNGVAITRTATQVVRAETTPLSFAGEAGGTQGLFRLKYPIGMTVTAQCKVQVRGRTGAQEWEQRKSVQNFDVVELTAVPGTDEISADGLWQYSYCDPAVHAFDRLGCAELVVGIHTQFAGTGGSAAAASVEGKAL